MSSAPITAVPLHEDDLVHRASINGFTITEAWSRAGRIRMHAHASFSLTILLRGAFEERYRPLHRPQDCEPGSLLIRPAGEVHENHLGRRGARTLSIELAPERLELGGKSLGPLLSLALVRETAFLDIGLALANELRREDAATPLALESLTLELLARLVRIGESISHRRLPAGVLSNAPLPWLLRSRDSIHDRFREQSLRVSTLAVEAGVHPVYFARAFRRQYGFTPGEYVRRLRQEFAVSKVLDSAESLAAIALESGFADQSHMHRSFRRRLGLSPGQLRHRRHPESRPAG